MMLFIGTYIQTFVNHATTGGWDHKVCQFEVYAASLKEAIKKDKEYWNYNREPTWFEEIVLDTHLASIATFVDREMPYLLAS